ncbi:hypothetical protein COO60DRAFT_1296468 [Scenedesmus sp. NREL 46B-D3]|nr:hypothetical protein COO60DRAFT_1296468 [Scenedesmus sp. NREL 46B-D3]
MHACVCVGRLQEAEALLEPLRERAGAASRAVLSGHNLLLKAHAQAGNPGAARKLFAAMKARGLAPDAVTYNTLLAAFVAAGEVLRARAVLDKMQREGVAPDAWSYTSLLLGLGRQGQLAEARQVLRDMAAAGLTPNEVRAAAGGWQLLESLATAGLDPDQVLLTSLLQAAGKAGNHAAALELFDAAAAAGQAAPPIEGFAALIRGYRNAGIKSRAVAALRRFLSLGGRPGRVMCNDVITLCLRDDDVKTARQVVRAMELTGCLSDADLGSYHDWFQRWEARNAAAVPAAAGAGSSAAAMAGGYSGAPGGSGSGPGGAAGQAAAVERLKWWLGLPNSYYVDSSGDSSRDDMRRRQ